MNTPETVKAAMGAALVRNQTRYAPSSGIPELRQAILAKVRDRNRIPADDEAPVVVNGGMQGLFAAFATLLDPGDEVLMLLAVLDADRRPRRVSPGAVPVLVPTARRPARRARRGARGEDDGRGRRSSTGTTRPTRPATSSRAPRPRRSRAFARERGLAVIADEAYEDLVYEGEPTVAIASLPGMFERTITCYTLSKSYSMTGWRARLRPRAEAVPDADQDRRALHDQRRLDADAVGGASRPSARGTEFVAEWKAGYRSRRDRLVAGLKAAGFELETPRAALYLFPKTPAWLAVRLPRGRARAARRGEDRDRAGDRLRPRGRGPPALLVFRVGGDDRGRRRRRWRRSRTRPPDDS